MQYCSLSWTEEWSDCSALIWIRFAWCFPLWCSYRAQMVQNQFNKSLKPAQCERTAPVEFGQWFSNWIQFGPDTIERAVRRHHFCLTSSNRAIMAALKRGRAAGFMALRVELSTICCAPLEICYFNLWKMSVSLKQQFRECHVSHPLVAAELCNYTYIIHVLVVVITKILLM